MKELDQIIYSILRKNGKEDIIEKIDQEKNVYPFGRENRMLAYLLSLGAITFDQYEKISEDYARRN